MSIPRTLNRFHGQSLVFAAAVVLLACCWQRSAAAATINVTTTQQGVTDGQCSLQEAIYASTFRASTAIRSTNPDVTYTTGCTAGTGDDTFVLAPGALYRFDSFWAADSHNIFGPTATPIIVSKIIIVGNGATLQLFDSFSPVNTRLFAIGRVNAPGFPSRTGDLTLQNVYIKDFHVKGGDGATGGGGGLGAGGAIYNEGSLTVENSTFEHNGAVGGTGGRPHSGGWAKGWAGGGGGLSGNGGAGDVCSDSAGGGGGSRGNGATGVLDDCGAASAGGGGGGGGTAFSGGDGQSGGAGGAGGFRCGGGGGDSPIFSDHDGRDASCDGGGGGGAGGNSNMPLCLFVGTCYPEGGDGRFGGGGGGGVGDGGNGGFGGGGGAGWSAVFVINGGNGGFGGGGGAAGVAAFFYNPGAGGRFGGHADDGHGGGGGALGGAIFNRNGTVTVRNSTFFNNYVTRGESGGGSAANGADAGGAIFSMGQRARINDTVSSLDVNDSTFSGNQSTGSGAAIVVIKETGISVPPRPWNWPWPLPWPWPPYGSSSVSFVLNNTIIANNGLANECFFTGSVSPPQGDANLIMQNGSGTGPFQKCPGVVTSNDPQLQPLQANIPGNTPTMAITTTSPAADKGDLQTSLAADQRGVNRGDKPDIGAFEAVGKCPEAGAFLARANTIVAIDAPHTAAYNDLICGLVEDGTYSKLDALYVLATQSGGDAPGDGIAKLNLIKNSFDLVRHGTFAFSADKGAACDGSSGYYDTQFNLSTPGVAFSRDSASLGVYDRSTTLTTMGTVFGAIQAGTFTALDLSFNGGLLFRINSLGDAPVAANTNPQGFWIGTRTGPSAVSVYRNGNAFASSTTPSSGVPALPMYLCASNLDGVPSLFVADQVSAFFIGGGLNAAQASNLSSRINAFMIAVGANVY